MTKKDKCKLVVGKTLSTLVVICPQWMRAAEKMSQIFWLLEARDLGNLPSSGLTPLFHCSEIETSL